jgi:hypothetical protein
MPTGLEGERGYQIDEGYAKFEGNTRNEWFRFTGYETSIATSIQTSIFGRGARSTHFCATIENQTPQTSRGEIKNRSQVTS